METTREKKYKRRIAGLEAKSAALKKRVADLEAQVAKGLPSKLRNSRRTRPTPPNIPTEPVLNIDETGWKGK